MKKMISLIIVLLLLLCGCGGEPQETTGTPDSTHGWSGEGPEGILDEKETVTVYQVVSMTMRDTTGNMVLRREYSYDETGFCTEEYEETAAGELHFRRVNTPDGRGNIATSEISEFGGRNYEIRYTYDSSDRVILEEIWQEGVRVEYTEYTYDEHDNFLTLKQYYGDELMMDYTFRYSYDGNGNPLTVEESLFGQLICRIEYTYDDQGRELSCVSYMDSGEIQNRTESSWDGLTETREYFSGAETVSYMTNVSTYDESGNKIFEEIRSGGELSSLTEYVYEPFEVKK
jgi:hypothetical protein